MGVIEVENVKAYYITDVYGVKRTVKAVDNISFDVKKNEILGIAGESGCGKSTLLKVLYGTIEPPLQVLGGKVNYNLDEKNYDILVMNNRELKEIRWKKASYVPQGSMNVLNPVIEIKKNFRDFIKTHRKKMTLREIDEMVRIHLNNLGLPNRLMDSYQHQLSGGMRQRVTIALATILKPDIIFADEPTTALDVIVQRGVIQLLKKIQREVNNSLVVVTHDMAIHANLTDRILIMYAGQIVEEAPTKEIFKNPQHYYTRHLIDSLPAIGDTTEKSSISGNPPPLDNLPSGCRFSERCSAVTEKCK